MHFEILVEDRSGKDLLEIIIPKIIDLRAHTFRINFYKGAGVRIPKDLHTTQDPSKRILLEQLPRLLRGYGKYYASTNYSSKAVVIVVIDCDKRDCKAFKQELNQLLTVCNPRPETFFRIAIEEMEAWLLGDRNAVRAAYPKFNSREYETYKQDSVVGTWEKLADIITTHGAKAFKRMAYFAIGKHKSEWAKNIGVHMDVQNNASPSFKCFREKLEEIAARV
jgi:hypothetical protein